MHVALGTCLASHDQTRGGFQFDVGLSENSEYLTLGGPYNKDPTISGTISSMWDFPKIRGTLLWGGPYNYDKDPTI